MARDSAYVAVYDMSDDRERTRVATVLEGFGLRVQFSAFELRLSPATRQTLLRRLEDLKLQTGFLYLYRRAGHQDRTAIGVAPADTLAESNHAWVIAAPAPRPKAAPNAPRSTRPPPCPRPTKPPLAEPARSWTNPVLPDGFKREIGTPTTASPRISPSQTS